MSFDDFHSDPSIEATSDTNAAQADDRPVWPSIFRGWRRKCPHCGSGPMFKGYLKVRDECAVCHEQLHHHRADDGPAYLTILIVAHIIAPVMHFVFVRVRRRAFVRIRHRAFVRVRRSAFVRILRSEFVRVRSRILDPGLRILDPGSCTQVFMCVCP